MKIAIVAYAGAMDSVLSGISEVLHLAKNKFNADVSKVSQVQEGQFPNQVFDVLIVPPSLNPSPPDPGTELIDWLKWQHRNDCVLASACAGSFILAGSGLLDGRVATTHWMLAQKFSEQYPGVKLQAERMIVDEGDIITAGGVTAWMDLVILLINRFFGSATAVAVGKFFLIDTGPRDQSFYTCFVPSLDHQDAVVLDVQQRIESHYHEKLTLDVMARWVHVNPRTLQRRFSAATGNSPITYLQKIRINKALQQLETSKRSLESIVASVGYEDVSYFRKLFRQQYGLSPSQYRKRFSTCRF